MTAAEALADVLDHEGFGYWVDVDQLVQTLADHRLLVAAFLAELDGVTVDPTQQGDRGQADG